MHSSYEVISLVLKRRDNGLNIVSIIKDADMVKVATTYS